MTDAEKRIREALAAVERGFHVEIKSVDIAALLAELERLRQKLRGADAFERSVSEALNSGDGSYRP